MSHLASHLASYPEVARSRARRLVVLPLLFVAAIVAACAEVGTDPDEAVSIEFNRLPSPSILVGDTLRDLLGKVVVLRDSVWVFNRDNDPLASFPVSFVPTTDSAHVVWDPVSGYVVSNGTTLLGTVGLQAQAGGLFPPPVSLAIVQAAPTTIAKVDPDTTVLLAINFTRRDTLSESSEEVTVRLSAADTAVSTWPVQFVVVSVPASLDSVAFIATRGDTLRSSKASPFDTTTSGSASRFILAHLRAGAANGTDTLVVRARFRVRAAIVDSVEWRLPVIVNRTATASVR